MAPMMPFAQHRRPGEPMFPAFYLRLRTQRLRLRFAQYELHLARTMPHIYGSEVRRKLEEIVKLRLDALWDAQEYARQRVFALE